MKIKLKNNSKNQIIIDIIGEIGNPTQTCFNQFADQLNAAITSGAKHIRVNIRSTGGAVQDALLIHSALATLPPHIQISTHCYGFCASAATIIAQAASEEQRYVASSAMYLIHNASAAFEGTAEDAQSAAALLSKTDQQIADIYAARSAKKPHTFIELMSRAAGQGEWLTPEQVIQAGLADRIEQISPIASLKNLFRQIFDTKTPADPLLADVLPSQTIPKDDPAIDSSEVQVAMSQNQSAYLSDVGLFRE